MKHSEQVNRIFSGKEHAQVIEANQFCHLLYQNSEAFLTKQEDVSLQFYNENNFNRKSIVGTSISQ